MREVIFVVNLIGVTIFLGLFGGGGVVLGVLQFLIICFIVLVLIKTIDEWIDGVKVLISLFVFISVFIFKIVFKLLLYVGHFDFLILRYLINKNIASLYIKKGRRPSKALSRAMVNIKINYIKSIGYASNYKVI